MSDFRIITKVLGSVSTNCYFIYHDQTKEAVIIDPADNPPAITAAVRAAGLIPKAVLLTHGHFDHILAAAEIKAEYQIPLYAGEKEAALLADSRINLSAGMGRTGIELQADRWLRDGETFSMAGFIFQVIATPGHTEGSVCYYIAEEKTLISGDTLFHRSLGRTDFPTGDYFAILHSLRNVLFKLPPETIVAPGHGQPTSIEYERKYNPAANIAGQ